MAGWGLGEEKARGPGALSLLGSRAGHLGFVLANLKRKSQNQG